ncbi:MAG: GtrA family protein, partial [Pseudonocardiaceae bacterium]
MSARVRQGMRRSRNWVQLVKFSVVGGSGYVVNLAVFTLAFELGNLHHLGAATIAFAVAVTNNFWWNRHWTFGARDGHV